MPDCKKPARFGDGGRQTLRRLKDRHYAQIRAPLASSRLGRSTAAGASAPICETDRRHAPPQPGFTSLGVADKRRLPPRYVTPCNAVLIGVSRLRGVKSLAAQAKPVTPATHGSDLETLCLGSATLEPWNETPVSDNAADGLNFETLVRGRDSRWSKLEKGYRTTASSSVSATRRRTALHETDQEYADEGDQHRGKRQRHAFDTKVARTTTDWPLNGCLEHAVSVARAPIMPDADLMEQLDSRLQDDFSRDLLRGALAALTQQNVATRAQHFSVSMRDLSEHMLKQLAPNDETVRACAWYEQHPKVQGPTRRQRAFYASRGGLTDAFLKDGLKLDPNEFHAEIGPALNELNKRTHLKPDKVITDPAELDTLANETIGATRASTSTINGIRQSARHYDQSAGDRYHQLTN